MTNRLPEEATCKHCKHWESSAPNFGICLGKKEETKDDIWIWGGGDAETGPDFGCSRHQYWRGEENFDKFTGVKIEDIRLGFDPTCEIKISASSHKQFFNINGG